MIKVLYPIHIDNWNQSIPSKFREIVRNCQESDIHFYSGSKAQSQTNLSPLPEPLWNRPNLTKISKLDLLTKQFDIIHNARATATSVAVTSTVLLRSLHRTKYVYTVSIEPAPGQWHFKYAQILTKMADVVIANSQAVARSMERYLHRSADYVIPNGVDTEFFSPSAADVTTRQRYGIREPYILYVGSLQPRKRPDIFVALAKCLPEVDFVMVGPNPRTNPLNLNDLPKNVKYLNLIPKQDVRNLLATSQAMVFPSELEGLPNAVLEAISMGVPVLAQAKTSLPEIIQDGENGWLLEADKLDQWVDLLQEIIDWDDERRCSFRDASRAATVRTRSWRTYTQSHVELYRQLCAAT